MNDKGSDDDDPIRSRLTVIDAGNTSTAALLDFYRATYPAADGWAQHEVDRTYQRYCLIRHSDKGYAELVEIFPYKGSRVEAEPDRYLVSNSRIQNLEPGADKKSCGLALAWIPSDLF